MKKLTLFYIGLFLISSSACKFENELDEIQSTISIENIDVPDDFYFETGNTITLTVNDYKNNSTNVIKYDVYLFDSLEYYELISVEEEDESISEYYKLDYSFKNNLVASIFSSNNSLSKNLHIPIATKQLYIQRTEMGIQSDHIIDIENGYAQLTRENTSFKSTQENEVTDIFYCVNGSGDVFTINQTTGELAIISEYPENSGSYNCAIDTANRVMYTTSRLSPNKLWLFDIDELTWTSVGDFQSGPRMAYDHVAEEIYFSNNTNIWILDPNNAAILRTVDITNFVPSSSAGDIIFDSDGTTYISSTSGIFKGTIANDILDLTYISAASLPTTPTSLTIDSERQLWWAGNPKIDGVNKGSMYIMDKETGAFEERFEPYDVQINDLTTLPYRLEDVPDTDSDGDGIIDQYDLYPNDGERASNEYTPSIFGNGTYAFEDLWPDKGDYDFNDLVINYKYIDVRNAADLAIETKIQLSIKHIGAGYRNGFGIELDIPESSIESVSGYSHSTGLITLNSKNLEANQSKPVIVAFDDVNTDGIGSEIEILITYTEPIALTNLGNVNPFIIINQERGREVHLSNKPPTSLGGLYLGTADDNSGNGVYYQSQDNLPWAIDIVHDFAFPSEKVEITQGYQLFSSWVESGGEVDQDWYKEHNRSSQYLY